MELTINVMVDVTPTLKKLCEAFLAGTPRVIETTKPIEAKPVKVEVLPEAVPEQEVPAKVEAEKPEEITNVMLRDAMEEVRKKFEFTDPQNPDVANAEIHKALNHQFKEIARSFGADKPTALAQEKRAEFLDELAMINVNSDGVVSVLPF